MRSRKTRWSKVYESSEEELIAFLESRKLVARRDTAEELSVKSQQISTSDVTFWCAEGSLTIRQDSTSVSLQPGDALTINANVPYDVRAGITGYVCYITG